MTDDPSYRLYLEERFKEFELKLDVQTKLLNAQFINVNDKLDSIEKHVIQTNGRVGELECESIKRQVVVDDFRKLEKGIGALKKKWFWVLLGAVIFVIIFASLGEVIGLKKVFELWLNKM